MNYGYIRVSTREQNEDRQVAALLQWGVTPDHIYLDKQSGKNFDRPAYRRLMRRLRQGDALIVKSIDRLGRNYDEILEQWRRITKEIHADVVVLDMPLLDTRSSRDLTGTLIADIVLQLLSYVAQTEREFIHQRQAEGIAAAKARGVKFGRKPIQMPDDYPTVCALWRTGQISARGAARQLGVSPRTFKRWTENVELVTNWKHNILGSGSLIDITTQAVNSPDANYPKTPQNGPAEPIKLIKMMQNVYILPNVS